MSQNEKFELFVLFLLSTPLKPTLLNHDLGELQSKQTDMLVIEILEKSEKI
jgi:hypothetical protein